MAHYTDQSTYKEELYRVKLDLMHTLGHELKTPLTGVLGLTELMLHQSLPAQRQQKYLAAIYKEVHRLVQLVNDLLDVEQLDVEQIEAAKPIVQKQRIDMADIVTEVMTPLNLYTNRHTLLLERRTEDAKITADPSKIKQVLYNLLSNAIKYSPDGGRVSVRLYKDDRYMCVDVADEGIGIPPHVFPLLFRKYYRVADAAHKGIAGTGLGLAIAREIVAAHGGKIDVQSEWGKGSTFMVKLPI